MIPARPYDGKLGIVTGGSRGIGEAIARRLAAKGCNLLLVYTSDSSRDRIKRTAGELTAAHNISCATLQADLGEAAAATAAILAAAQRLSANLHLPFRVDILVNNAGVASLQCLNDAEAGPITTAEFTRVYAVNVLAPLLLTQAVAPHLPLDRSGRIINVSSVGASIGLAAGSVYVGTKAALEGMTRTWSRELAGRATVNAVSVGPVWDDMYRQAGPRLWDMLQPWADAAPLAEYDGEEHVQRMAGEEAETFDSTVRERMGGRRPAFTSEVAGTVDMLCSEEAGWTTGSVVSANGGMRMTVA